MLATVAPPPPMIFFLLVSSAVGHGHDNTPTHYDLFFFANFFEVGKKMSLSDFFRPDAIFLGSRSSSDTFCPPPPP